MSGASPERVHDLEGAGLLALDAGRVDGVDQEHRVGLPQLPGDVQAVVEVAVHLQQRGAVRDGLAQLAHGDLAFGNQHGALQAGRGGVGGSGGRGIAGGGADNGLGAGFNGGGHGHGHAAVLEGTGGVHSLDLQVHGGTGQFGELLRVHQRSAAFAQGDDPGGFRHGQTVSVFADNAAPLVSHLDSFYPQNGCN